VSFFSRPAMGHNSQIYATPYNTQFINSQAISSLQKNMYSKVAYIQQHSTPLEIRHWKQKIPSGL